MIDRTQVKTYLDEIAGAFGFSNARQAFNVLIDDTMRRRNEGSYMGAVQMMYRENPETPTATMVMFISDMLIEPGGGLTFYSLSPSTSDPAYNEHFERLIEIGREIQTGEQLLDYLKNPEKLGVPVQREFHNVLSYSSSMAGVVNYNRDFVTNEVRISVNDSFTPVIEKTPIRKAEKPERGDGTVTPLTPRPKKIGLFDENSPSSPCSQFGNLRDSGFRPDSGSGDCDPGPQF